MLRSRWFSLAGIGRPQPRLVLRPVYLGPGLRPHWIHGRPDQQVDDQPDHEVLSRRRAFGDRQGQRGQRLGVEPMVHLLLPEVEEEQQRADALVAVGKGVVLDDEIQQMRRLLLAAVVFQAAPDPPPALGPNR